MPSCPVHVGTMGAKEGFQGRRERRHRESRGHEGECRPNESFPEKKLNASREGTRFQKKFFALGRTVPSPHPRCGAAARRATVTWLSA